MSKRTLLHLTSVCFKGYYTKIPPSSKSISQHRFGKWSDVSNWEAGSTDPTPFSEHVASAFGISPISRFPQLWFGMVVIMVTWCNTVIKNFLEKLWSCLERVFPIFFSTKEILLIWFLAPHFCAPVWRLSEGIDGIISFFWMAESERHFSQGQRAGIYRTSCKYMGLTRWT